MKGVVKGFLCTKLKELIRKVFSRDDSFGEKIDNGIKELQAKLGSGELSKEEFAKVLERLDALQNFKLKLQMFVVCWVISALAQMFGVKFSAAIGKAEKVEKTSLKETAKEICENVEIKVDAKEKLTVIVPVSLFDFHLGLQSQSSNQARTRSFTKISERYIASCA